MNQNFVCIKVDREERPDVDQIYMDACQLMTGRGGWPLNVICLPDKRPVYAGTYFRKDHWMSVLSELSALWNDNRKKMFEYAGSLNDGLKQINLVEFPRSEKLNKRDLKEIWSKIREILDYENGGISQSQKFPMPVVAELLLDEFLSNHNEKALEFVNFTLIKMANSSLWDHVRGGFYRYATRRDWFAPHFEKMLYDNAQLLSVYSRAFAVSGIPLFRDIAEGIITFVNRELRSVSGGIYSALDADSEGTEGKFYVFNAEELKNSLNAEELELASVVYNFKDDGNWEHGNNILHKTLSPAQILDASGLSADDYKTRIERIHQVLFSIQEQRIRPDTDTKIITSWNALWLKGLADAGRFLKEVRYIAEAESLGQWLLNEQFHGDKLLRTHTEKGNYIYAFSEDYACLIQAFTALYEATGKSYWLTQAKNLSKILISDFYDNEMELFSTSSIQQTPLIVHKFDISDDVIPSPNSTLCLSLQKLGLLCEDHELYNTGFAMLNRVRSQVLENPVWYAQWTRAIQAETIGIIQIGFTGHHCKELKTEMDAELPSWAVIGTDSADPSEFIQTKKQSPKNIHICVGESCLEPVNSLEQAREILEDILS